MKIPRHWVRAEADAQPADRPGPMRVALWRGSDESVEHARRLAESAVRALVERIGVSGFSRHPYPYPDRALREQILEELGEAGERSALVTRNGYGAEVLNAVGLFTADLDYPRGTGGGAPGLLGKLLGRPSPREAAEASFRARIERHLADQPFASFRLYQTAAGLRALRTDTPKDAASDETRAALEALGSDPTYVKLCRGQGCFRARLTPKPWRIGVPAPPGRFPRTPDAERRFEEWLARYRQRALGHATCAFVATLGSGRIADELAPLVRLHDDRTGADTGRPLA